MNKSENGNEILNEDRYGCEDGGDNKRRKNMNSIEEN